MWSKHGEYNSIKKTVVGKISSLGLDWAKVSLIINNL